MILVAWVDAVAVLVEQVEDRGRLVSEERARIPFDMIFLTLKLRSSFFAQARLCIHGPVHCLRKSTSSLISSSMVVSSMLDETYESFLRGRVGFDSPPFWLSQKPAIFFFSCSSLMSAVGSFAPGERSLHCCPGGCK